MKTHKENKHELMLVNVGVPAKVKKWEASEIANTINKRLEVLPISCEYLGLVYSPLSSHGEVIECQLLLGFSSEKNSKVGYCKCLAIKLRFVVKSKEEQVMTIPMLTNNNPNTLVYGGARQTYTEMSP